MSLLDFGKSVIGGIGSIYDPRTSGSVIDTARHLSSYGYNMQTGQNDFGYTAPVAPTWPSAATLSGLGGIQNLGSTGISTTTPSPSHIVEEKHSTIMTPTAPQPGGTSTSYVNPNQQYQNPVGQSGPSAVQPMNSQQYNQSVNTGFNAAPDGNAPIPSNHLSSDTSMQDLFARRQQLENDYLKNYNDYASAKTAEQVGQLNDMSREQNALYSTPDSEVNLGIAGLVKNQDIIKQAARAVQTQGPLLASQGIGNLLGYQNQDIQNVFAGQANQRANATEFGNFQVNQVTGDVFGTTREPRTGAIGIANFGNIYNDTFNNANPQPQGGGGGAVMGQAGVADQTLRQQAYNYGTQAGLPQPIASAVVKTPFTGDYFISGSQVPGGMEAIATSASGRSGVAYVPQANVPNIQQLDIVLSQTKRLSDLAAQYLTPGFLGRLKGMTTNQISSFLQLDPGWAKFNQARLSAIDYLKGLAQGGGFRTTQSEIDTAQQSLTDITDSFDSSKAKIETAVQNIDNAFKEYLPTHQDTNISTWFNATGGSSSGTGATSGSIYSF